MYNIFKHDKHGVWLQNNKKEVVLIERDFKNYAKEFLAMFLIHQGLTKQDAEQISKTIIKYRSGYIGVGA